MSTCKIKASAAFIMHLIWKDIYSHYIKFFKKRKSVCKFRLALQQFVEREIQSFSECELEFAGIPQFGRADMDIVSPLLPHSDNCSPELSPLGANGIFVPPVCVASSGPTDIYRPIRAFANACLCSVHTGGFMSAVSQQGIVLYRV